MLETREPRELFITALPDLTARTIVVMGDPDTAEENSFVLRLVDAPGFRTAAVVWDRRIIVEEVVDMIRRAPEIQKKMDEDTLPDGSRKLRVEEIFTTPSTAYPVFPVSQAPEELKKFDHPEELAIIDENGVAVIVRKRDLPYIQRRREEMNKLLREEDISPDTVGDMDIQKILDLRRMLESKLMQ